MFDAYIAGNPLQWGEHLRLRHLPTRMYLYVVENEIGLTVDGTDAQTVFRFVCMNQVRHTCGYFVISLAPICKWCLY